MICSYPMKPVRVDEEIFSRIDSSQYTMESKYDGFRCLLNIGKTVKMFTREMRFMETPDCLDKPFKDLNIPEDSIFDGEIWNVSKRGAWRHDRSSECQIVIWDVIKLAGKYKNESPIEERRDIVERYIPNNSFIKPVDIFEANKTIYEDIKQNALNHRESTKSKTGYIHGVVIKKNRSVRRDHPNRSFEHPDWMKIVFI